MSARGNRLGDFSLASGRRAWTRRLFGLIDETAWNALALELFTWQATHLPAYRRLIAGRGINPRKIESWQDIPAIPQQLFKRTRLFSHPASRSGVIYETSGTTTGQPGRQYLLDAGIYRAVAVEGARRVGLFEGQPELFFLVSSPDEAPHSSLSAMFSFWRKALRQKGNRFQLRKGVLDPAACRKTLAAAIKQRHPIGLCGTAFSFVHLIDSWAGLSPLPLPRGSWILETGGFKGLSREVAKAGLYGQIAEVFSVPDDAIWNEYGMSELSSQAYARGASGLHWTPPWARVLVCDPATGREVAIGRRGLVCWVDLANVDSVLAVQTLDLAERTRGGFRLIGRMVRTEPRGCSLGAEDLVLRTAALRTAEKLRRKENLPCIPDS
ncbi:MAG TPA: acyl-protein synthetase [Candidatus Methylacidiphilales bacterium]|nr:acyl-protein synthetase [Candidatus Methylacidiphilales bacterium]